VRSLLSAAIVALLLSFLARDAGAQIKEPDHHPKYGVELEPHFVAQWAEPFWGGTGIGAGLRVSIPVIDNGPITTINNSLAIGFGFDWAHFSGACWDWWGPWRLPGPRPPGAPPPPPPADYYAYNCSGNSVRFPAVAQWNFFFTKVVSVFAEAGLGVEYATWTADYPCAAGVCRPTGHDLFVEPLFFVGPRFILSDAFAITLRLGWPYLSAGVSFLL
jgi:hypothetical protein